MLKMSEQLMAALDKLEEEFTPGARLSLMTSILTLAALEGVRTDLEELHLLIKKASK